MLLWLWRNIISHLSLPSSSLSTLPTPLVSNLLIFSASVNVHLITSSTGQDCMVHSLNSSPTFTLRFPKYLSAFSVLQVWDFGSTFHSISSLPRMICSAQLEGKCTRGALQVTAAHGPQFQWNPPHCGIVFFLILYLLTLQFPSAAVSNSHSSLAAFTHLPLSLISLVHHPMINGE